MKTVPNPCDSHHFGLGHVGEYFIYCPNRNVCGKEKKATTLWAFSFKAKTHGVDQAWAGVHEQPSKQNVWRSGCQSENALVCGRPNQNAWVA